MTLALVSTGSIAQAEDVNQFTRLLTGQSGYGNPVALNQLSDSSNYALTVRNLDGTNSKGLLVQDASSNTLLAVNAGGVTMSTLNFSPANANIAAETALGNFAGVTYTMTNNVGTQRFYRFRIPTLAANAARTTTNAATVAIEGPPAASGTGPVTITNGYALWVEAGTTRLEGAASLGSTLAVGGAATFAGAAGFSGLVTAAAGLTVSGGSVTLPAASIADAALPATLAGKTLTGATLTSPTINGATLTGTLAGTPTFSGAPTFSAGLTVSASGATIVGNSSVTGTLNVTSTLSQGGATVATLTGNETLTNKTLTSPTINGAALSGTLSGSPTLSGTITLSQSTAGSAVLVAGNAGTTYSTVPFLFRVGGAAAVQVFEIDLAGNKIFSVDGNGVVNLGYAAGSPSRLLFMEATAVGVDLLRAEIGGALAFSVLGTGKLVFGASASIRQTTVGAAGGASALPATPSEYLRVTINGNERVIPMYAQA